MVENRKGERKIAKEKAKSNSTHLTWREMEQQARTHVAEGIKIHLGTKILEIHTYFFNMHFHESFEEFSYEEINLTYQQFRQGSIQP